MGFLERTTKRALYVALLLTAGLVVLLLLGAAFMLPAHMHVERETVIARPASQIHAVLDSHRRYPEWAPWSTRDTERQYTTSGPEHGVGATVRWNGDTGTGASGSETIVESTDRVVATRLAFGPDDIGAARYVLTPGDHRTRVTWTYDRDLPLRFDRTILANLTGRFLAAKRGRELAASFDRGLARLRTLVESFPDVDIAGIAPTIEEVPARTILYVRAGSGVDAESTHAALNAAYAEVLTTMAANGLRATGQPLTLTSAYDGVTWTFDAGIPVDGTAVPEDTSALVGSTPDGKVARLVHVGGFATMPGTIDKLYAWIVVHGYAPRDRMIQDYVSDPSTTPAGRMETRISVPIR